MKRIVYCTLSLLILLLPAGCAETIQETDAVMTRATTVPEMTAQPTPYSFDSVTATPHSSDNVTQAPTPRNSDNVIPAPTLHSFDVDDVSMQPTPGSSCFSEVGYDSDWNVLVVRFRNSNSVYTYSDFPKDEWDQFIAADSLGRWYNAHIKGRYEYEKIDG